jgi:hypothetical protein
VSIALPSERAEHWAPKERSCFFCSELVPADTIAVIWVSDSGLLFHPDCAERLGSHLIGDAREATLATGNHPWSRRAARAAGAALAAQEVRS